MNKFGKTGLILTAVLCMTMFFSCENGWWGANALNAVLYDNAGKWIDLDFQRENVTRGFWDGLYLINGEFVCTDESYPRERTFIISDQAEFDTILIRIIHRILSISSLRIFPSVISWPFLLQKQFTM